MSELLTFPESMLWPLAACLVLTGIHVYLGVHVIARKVIFVDLALAQIAALGSVIGALMGYEFGKDSTALYLYSLAFTIFGAFIFSVTKTRGERIPHEAIIGIVYAVTFAATILILARSALGPQELDHIIKGELLWVQGATVVKTAIIYAAVGVFHIIFRRQFMALSFDGSPEARSVRLESPRAWDFLFYMSFGFVITSSVAIAGVFLVFSYLVIPAVGAMLFTERLGTRLIIGWVGGAVISILGAKFSYDTGLPTSPLIVVMLAATLVLAAIIRTIRLSARPFSTMRNLLLGTGAIAAFIAGVWIFKKPVEDPMTHALHQLESSISTDRLSAMRQLGSYVDRREEWKSVARNALRDEDSEVRQAALEALVAIGDKDMVPTIVEMVSDRSDRVRISAIGALAHLGGRPESDLLSSLASEEPDPEIRISMLRVAAELGNVHALVGLSSMTREGGVFAPDAEDVLRHHLDLPNGSFTRQKLADWVAENRTLLEWDSRTHRFRIGGPVMRRRGHE